MCNVAVKPIFLLVFFTCEIIASLINIHQIQVNSSWCVGRNILSMAK